jgi:cytochrome c-type biogenesis protein CcmH
MTVFVVLSGMLIAGTLALLVPPLVRRRNDQARESTAADSNRLIYRAQLAELEVQMRSGAIGPDEWSNSRNEIERRALEDIAERQDRPMIRLPGNGAVAVAIAVPFLAVALYAFIGTPEALAPESGAAAAPEHALTPENLATMVDRLAARLGTKPDDTEGWIMLGRSNAVLGRHAQSAAAYARAAAQRPGDAQLLTDYADALAMAQGRNLTGEPEALINRALEADGDNVKALALAGTIAFDRGSYGSAIDYWHRGLKLAQPDSDFAQSMRGGIQEAEDRMRPVQSAGAPARVMVRKVVERQGPVLEGRVSLAPAAALKTKPEDSVYVFARAVAGPRMPLAVLRRQVKDLPFDFSLDDSMAMSPALKLSSFDKVVVVARISKSGLAAPQKGDLEAATGPLAPAMTGIRLEIGRSVE